ncbi:hypothetical protein HGB07_01540 [Candidatus Roizmanbacteria bacterium]|nr:hypothetical protein [Candidatus Roizmanbacteria bacterium]
MKQAIHYWVGTLRLELKKLFVYRGSFWIFFITQPFWSLTQVFMIESMFGQTNNIAGYNRFNMYILLGTYRIIGSLGFVFVFSRLIQLPNLVRGTDPESLDVLLTKPIDSQVVATTGSYFFGAISSTLLGFIFLGYGITHLREPIVMWNVFAYICLLVIGLMLYYITLLFFRTLVFWFEELYATRELWESLNKISTYPSRLFTGPVGIFFNLVLPIGLAGAIPAEMLTGKIEPIMLLYYCIVVTIFFYLSRKFWQISIKRYSSFSS